MIEEIVLSHTAISHLICACPAVANCTREEGAHFIVTLPRPAVEDLESLCLDGESIDEMLVRTWERTVH